MNDLAPRTQKRGFRRIALGLLGGFCLALLLGLPHIPAVAQINQAVIQEVVDGDEVFIEEQQASVSDRAQFREKVRTEGQTRTSISFSNGAAGRLGQNASVIVGQCIEVESGQLLVSGPANGCLSGFTVAVEGTIYVLEKDPDNPNSLGSLRTIEGEVQINKPEEPGRPAVPISLAQGQKVSVAPTGELQRVEPIPAEEFASILTGPLFEGYREPIPNQSRLQGVCRELYPTYNCTTAGVPVRRSEPVRGLW
ncbi:MAG: hypothetical protein SW833_27600 [Cyanobacteriota bacterium]|nr:hypothetical protein [Cyanobacteriota bacterium]